MSNSLPAIEVKNLGKRFQNTHKQQNNLREKIYDLIGIGKSQESASDFWALRKISFEIKRGEVMAIIGANGAGKSTLLKLLAQIMDPTEGSILFRGKVVSILDIGTGFHPDLTGIENIYLSGSLLRMSREEIDVKLKTIIEFSELGDFLHRQVKYYSSGMFLRLAFSVCTHLEAEILLLDEVISVGDAAFASKSLKRIREIASQGKTIVLASHDLASVQHISTQCILLDKGNLVEVGDTLALVERYIEQGVFKSLSDVQQDLSNSDPSYQQSYLVNEKIFSPNESSGKGIRLMSMCVRSASNTGNFNMTDPIKLTCEFEKTLPGSVAVTFVMSYNMQPVFLSADSFNAQSVVSLQNEMGLLEATCTFPPVFFNHGIFSVSVYFSDAAGELIHAVENALTFKIQHNELATGEISYKGKFTGPLFPKLNWEIKKKTNV